MNLMSRGVLEEIRIKLFKLANPHLEYVRRKSCPHFRAKPPNRRYPSKYQAQMRLLMSKLSYGLYGKVKGFKYYKGSLIPAVAAEVGRTMRGLKSEDHLTTKDIERIARLQRAKILYAQKDAANTVALREIVKKLEKLVT